MDSVLARSLRAGATGARGRVILQTQTIGSRTTVDGWKYVRCVMRKRWFVIRDYLRASMPAAIATCT